MVLLGPGHDNHHPQVLPIVIVVVVAVVEHAWLVEDVREHASPTVLGQENRTDGKHPETLWEQV